LLISGLMTRLISIPFIAEMIVAISATKISLYLGTSPLPLPPSPPQFGIWAVLHEVRSEYAQLLTTAFLLVNGPGKWSLDALLQRREALDWLHRRCRTSILHQLPVDPNRSRGRVLQVPVRGYHMES